MRSLRRMHRWGYVAISTILMVCFGTVYAWSYFQGPLMRAYGWNNSQVSLAFSLAIFLLGSRPRGEGFPLPKWARKKSPSPFNGFGRLAWGRYPIRWEEYGHSDPFKAVN